jgi:hypothetical protein
MKLERKNPYRETKPELSSSLLERKRYYDMAKPLSGLKKQMKSSCAQSLYHKKPPRCDTSMKSYTPPTLQ